jgi:hypothetical protein
MIGPLPNPTFAPRQKAAFLYLEPGELAEFPPKEIPEFVL